MDTPDQKSEQEDLDQLAVYLSGKFEGYRTDRQEWEAQWRTAWDRFNLVYKPEQDETEGVGGRSHHCYGLARKKVKVFMAHVDDLLHNQGKFPFEIENTPEPDFALEHLNGEISEESMQEIIEDQDRVGGMFLRMKDQLVEGKFRDELNSFLFQLALFGSGAVEGPLVDVRTRSKYTPVPIPVDLQVRDPQTGAVDPRSVFDNLNFNLERVEEPAPFFRQRDIWDVYPDLRTEDCHESEGIFVLDVFTESEFAEMAQEIDAEGKEIYNREKITEILNSGVSKTTQDIDRGPHRTNSNEAKGGEKERLIEVYTFHGRLMKKDIEEYVDLGESERNDEGERPLDDFLPIEAIVTYSNGKVLRAELNSNEKGHRLIKISPCVRVPGSPFGWGIPKEADQADSMFNAFMRLMLDNKRRASYVDRVVDRTRVENPDEVAHYDREWKVIPGASTDSIVEYLTTPDVSDNILPILEFCEQWGDASTGMPAFLEGADVQTSSQTAYEVSEQKGSSMKLLGLAMYLIDSRILEPCLEDLYDYNMKYDKDQTIKGDFKIVAKGYQSFRDITVRAVELRNLLSMGENPEVAKVLKVADIIRELSKLSGVEAETFVRNKNEQAEHEAQIAQANQQAMQQQFAMAQQDKQQDLQGEMAKQDQKHNNDMQKEGLKIQGDLAKQQQKLDSDEQRALLTEEGKRADSMLRHQQSGQQTRGVG